MYCLAALGPQSLQQGEGSYGLALLNLRCCCEVEEVAAFASCTALQHLNRGHCYEVKDVAAFAYCSDLRVLYLAFSGVMDITMLKGMSSLLIDPVLQDTMKGMGIFPLLLTVIIYSYLVKHSFLHKLEMQIQFSVLERCTVVPRNYGDSNLVKALSH